MNKEMWSLQHLLVHNVVCFGDPWVLAAAPPDLVDSDSILRLDEAAAPANASERRFVQKLSRRVGKVE